MRSKLMRSKFVCIWLISWRNFNQGYVCLLWRHVVWNLQQACRRISRNLNIGWIIICNDFIVVFKIITSLHIVAQYAVCRAHIYAIRNIMIFCLYMYRPMFLVINSILTSFSLKNDNYYEMLATGMMNITQIYHYACV